MANPLRRARQRANSETNGRHHAHGLATLDGQKDVRFGQLLSPTETSSPHWKEWSTEAGIRDGYKANAWVFAAVSRIAKAASSVPWKAYRVNGQEADEIDDAPLATLFSKPNPFIPGSKQMERIVMHLYLGGNALLTKVRPSSNAPVGELWPLPPDRINVYPSTTGLVERYEYDGGAGKRSFRPEDIVHFMFTDPSNIWWGISPLQAIARTVDTDVEAVRWNKITLQNLGRADGVLAFKNPLTKEQHELALEQIAEQRAGAENAHSIWVLGSEATFTPITQSPAELDFIESRKMTREEILAVYGVPKAIVGLVEHATQSDVQAMERIFWRTTVVTLLDDLQSAINLSIAPEFGENIELRYDVSNVEALRENYQEKVDQAAKLWAMGVPLNQINDKLEMGLEEIEGGDTGYISASLVAATGELPEVEEEPPNPNPVPPSEAIEEDVVEGEIEQEELEAGEEDEDADREAAGRRSPEEEKADADLRYWKAVDNRRLGYERALVARAEKRVRAEGDAIAKAFVEGGEFAAHQVIFSYRDGWETLIKATHTVVIDHFGNEVLSQFNKATSHTEEKAAPSLSKDFDPDSPEVQRWIRENAAKSATLLSQTSRKEAGRIIAEGMAAGATPIQISRDLRQLYSDRAPAKAARLGRTEVVRASNFGSHEGAKQSGLEYTRTWISSGDNRVRDTHASANGQTVKKTAPYYIAGYPAMYPGDPGLPPEEVIMCRCVETFNTGG